MREELMKGLTEEQKKKVAQCKNPEEIMALAREEGIELNEEQLGAVSGGACGKHENLKCPKCGSTKDQKVKDGPVADNSHKFKCGKCGYTYVAQ